MCIRDRDRQPAAYSIVGFVSTVIVFLALYRMFSRNLEKRRAENARFMAKVWYPCLLYTSRCV